MSEAILKIEAIWGAAEELSRQVQGKRGAFTGASLSSLQRRVEVQINKFSAVSKRYRPELVGHKDEQKFDELEEEINRFFDGISGILEEAEKGLGGSAAAPVSGTADGGLAAILIQLDKQRREEREEAERVRKEERDEAERVRKEERDEAERVREEAERVRKEELERAERLRKDELKALITQMQGTQAVAIDGQQPAQPANVPIRVNLPKPVIEPFTGDYTKWIAFRNLFKASVIDAVGVADELKLQYLCMYLKGDPLKLIEEFATVEGGFQLAWDLLEKTYTNKRKLIRQQIKTFFNLPKVNAVTAPAVKAIISKIDDALAILKSYKVNIENWDPFIVVSCLSQLPRDLLIKFENIENKMDDRLAKWSELREFLESVWRDIEGADDILGYTKPESKSHATNNKKVVSSHHLHKEAEKCMKCKSPHKLYSCSQFRQLNVKEKYQFLKQKKICFNCLDEPFRGQRNKCQLNTGCKECGKDHHTLLHMDEQHKVSSQNKQRERHVSPSSSVHQSAAQMMQGHNGSRNNTVVHSQAIYPHTEIASGQCQQVQSYHTSTAGSSYDHHPDTQQIRRVDLPLLRTAWINIIVGSKSHWIRALLDPASEVTLITQQKQRELNLPLTRDCLRVVGIENVPVNSTHACRFSVRTAHGYHDFEAYVVPDIASILPRHSFKREVLKIPKDMILADPQFDRAGPIDLIIGADFLGPVLMDNVQHLGPWIVAQLTIFGWTFMGRVKESAMSHHITIDHSSMTLEQKCEHMFNSDHVAVNHHVAVSHHIAAYQSFHVTQEDQTDLTLEEKFTQYFDQESVPRRSGRILSADEQHCEDHFAETTTREADGRYMVRLPFKREFPHELQLGASRNSAMKQYINLENKHKRAPEIAQEYNAILQEYVTMGHMEPSSKLGDDKGAFYMPHHAVVKPDSASTKVRIVFNGSCKTSSGLSLNDVMYVGPPLQNDLAALIIRWRTHRFVANADIAKMYRQIYVHPDDRPFQRVLLRPQSDGQIQDFDMTRVTFGLGCSPYLAIKTLHRIAEDHESEYPEVAKIIKENFYVDDLLHGGDDISEIKKEIERLRTIMAGAGLELKKWTANTPALLRDIPREDLLHDEFLTLDYDGQVKTLGIRWGPRDDCLTYAFSPKTRYTDTPTKRQMFSQALSIYDPAGYITPVTIRGKILMQRAWGDAIEWDQQLLPETLKRWQAYLGTLPTIDCIKIPRWTEFTAESSIQLVGFCDASQEASAAAIYMRIENTRGVFCHLVCSKTQLAPLKSRSIPRLELDGAVLLTDMMNYVLSIWPDAEIHCYTDSSIVLWWLSKSPHLLKTYVANRVAKIQTELQEVSWKHVSTHDNPADLPTRGVSPRELQNSSLWWHGPNWLVLPVDEWPKSMPDITKTEDMEVKDPMQGAIELRLHAILRHVDPNDDLLKNVSKWSTAIRVFAYIYRWFDRAVKQKRENGTQTVKSVDLTHAEIAGGTRMIFIATQQLYFEDEVRRLRNGREVAKHSPLRTMNPFLKDGVVRADTRIINAHIPYDEKCPILLPYNGRATLLMLRFIHAEVTLHGGNQLMRRTLRQGFWIPRASRLIKSVIDGCRECVIFKQKRQQQIMAALPEPRVDFKPAFTVTGLDFAGPFELKKFEGRCNTLIKGYCCVFVCFVTKAVHLEPVTDLSTCAFLKALDRFIARRGCPTDMYSDHGTNFKGADNEMQSRFKRCILDYAQAVREDYIKRQIKWTFIPPGAPHMGGLWEAAVNSSKKHLCRVMYKHRNLTFEEFATLLAKIEACLNSRPLCSLTDTPEGSLSITPAHLLMLRPMCVRPEPIVTERDTLRNRYELTQLMFQDFAAEWMDDYLHSLTKRFKWQSAHRNVKIGDVVVITRENLAPGDWLLGRVVEVRTNPYDGRVRSVMLKTAGGHLERPIHKLIVLPTEEDTPDLPLIPAVGGNPRTE